VREGTYTPKEDETKEVQVIEGADGSKRIIIKQRSVKKK
jgi:hypothetical protein